MEDIIVSETFMFFCTQETKYLKQMCGDEAGSKQIQTTSEFRGEFEFKINTMKQTLFFHPKS